MHIIVKRTQISIHSICMVVVSAYLKWRKYQFTQRHFFNNYCIEISVIKRINAILLSQFSLREVELRYERKRSPRKTGKIKIHFQLPILRSKKDVICQNISDAPVILWVQVKNLRFYISLSHFCMFLLMISFRASQLSGWGSC